MSDVQFSTVDAYTHCGISKYLPVADVSATMDHAGVDRAVLAQHLGEFDNSYLRGVVAANPDRYAGVCLVDHQADSAESILEELAGSSSCQGVRWPIAPGMDNHELVGRTLELGLVAVAYFPESIAACVATMDRLLEAHPSGKIVVSHLGNPTQQQADPLQEFRQAGVFQLLSAETLVIQLSGMEMTTRFPHAALHDLVGVMFEAVGPTRMTWGSNYPVVGTAEDYRTELRLLLDGRLPIPSEAIPAIAGANASRLWFPDREHVAAR
ncbi:MAG: hypothetical protein CMJ65_02040 [Planctomycetaceae bacterium]|jgi:predicted TIM-barrel fold metal-dependent hydrolase|nr:hypothetical protein [Planctomycetaceae bacterium]MDP7274501.1 amidohydrolase family protein [Planctomycetaceae bacterium]